ncbi:ankyrin repeat-containing domain protein, partial [Hyaloscypha sp. PMI_1271]
STAILKAYEIRDEELFNILVKKGADINTKESQRPLQLAVEYRENDTIQVLLEYGADINAKNNTILHIAAKAGNLAKLGILLDHGANINTINKKGQTTLITGATFIHILIERGADIEMANKDRNTALIFTTKHQDQLLEIIQILVKKGADSSTRNLKGLTTLIIVVGYGNVLGVECLL